MSLQLPLSLSIRDDASFDNFLAEGNQSVISHIKNSIGQEKSEGAIYVWGNEFTGKTHLLEAACLQAASLDLKAVYIPLKSAAELDVSMLDSLEKADLICVDDVDAIAGQQDWEQALFYLYNRAFEMGAQMIFSATQLAKEAAFSLPDLVSRLDWGFVFHIQALSDEHKAQALQNRARIRGFELPDNVIAYLLRRFPRDMNALFALLAELDKASLTAQRRLTVPFVKQWFDENKTQ